MPPDQLSDVTAQPGEIVAQPMPEPEPMDERWILVAWRHSEKFWEMPIRGKFWWFRRDAEEFAKHLPKAFTHYRIVRIPGDAKGCET